jgi:hypothetical protein
MTNMVVLGQTSFASKSTNQRGKEVRSMVYEKPELFVLGEAASLIQGSKIAPGEGLGRQSPDCEFDD